MLFFNSFFFFFVLKKGIEIGKSERDSDGIVTAHQITQNYAEIRFRERVSEAARLANSQKTSSEQQQGQE